MRLTVATTFATWPPHSGAALRNFHLYRAIARHCEVEIIGLVKQESGDFDAMIAPNLRECRVAISDRHLREELRICEMAGGRPVSDFAAGYLYPLTPRFEAALAASCARADIVVASHPHLFPALRRFTDKPLVYEAPDVEIDLKASHLAHDLDGSFLLQRIERTETLCLAEADLVLACNAHDRNRFFHVYGADPSRVLVVPNGADLSGIPPRDWMVRPDVNDLPVQCLFLASWGGPNNDAASFVVDLARQMPTAQFVIAGSVAHHAAGPDIPGNLRLAPDISDDEKIALLRSTDIALNPVLGGSGDNIKLGEYACAGALILTTPFGARGYPSAVTDQLLLRERDGFADAIIEAGQGLDLSAAQQRTHITRSWFADNRDWNAIGADCFSAIAALARPVPAGVKPAQDLVSILVPMLNGQDWIGECLDSLLDQSHGHVEVIVTDDGSSDASADIVRTFAAQDARVKLCHHAHRHNHGVSRSLELALQHATGDYVALCDADDRWRPDKLQLQIAALKRHPDAVMCHSRCRVIGNVAMEDVDHAQTHFDWLPVAPLYDALAIPDFLAMMNILNSSMVMRRDTLSALNFACTQVFQSEDHLITLLLATKGKFISLEDRLVDYRLHQKSYTSRVLSRITSDLYSRLEMLLIFATRVSDPSLQERIKHQIDATLWLLQRTYCDEASNCLVGA